jgi:hypothetical protein
MQGAATVQVHVTTQGHVTPQGATGSTDVDDCLLGQIRAMVTHRGTSTHAVTTEVLLRRIQELQQLVDQYRQVVSSLLYNGAPSYGTPINGVPGEPTHTRIESGRIESGMGSEALLPTPSNTTPSHSTPSKSIAPADFIVPSESTACREPTDCREPTAYMEEKLLPTPLTALHTTLRTTSHSPPPPLPDPVSTTTVPTNTVSTTLAPVTPRSTANEPPTISQHALRQLLNPARTPTPTGLQANTSREHSHTEHDRTEHSQPAHSHQAHQFVYEPRESATLFGTTYQRQRFLWDTILLTLSQTPGSFVTDEAIWHTIEHYAHTLPVAPFQRGELVQFLADGHLLQCTSPTVSATPQRALSVRHLVFDSVARWVVMYPTDFSP